MFFKVEVFWSRMEVQLYMMFFKHWLSLGYYIVFYVLGCIFVCVLFSRIFFFKSNNPKMGNESTCTPPFLNSDVWMCFHLCSCCHRLNCVTCQIWCSVLSGGLSVLSRGFWVWFLLLLPRTQPLLCFVSQSLYVLGLLCSSDLCCLIHSSFSWEFCQLLFGGECM